MRNRQKGARQSEVKERRSGRVAKQGLGDGGGGGAGWGMVLVTRNF